MNIYKVIVPILFFIFFNARATETIVIKHAAGDMTPTVRAAIEGAKEKDIKLVFSKDTYTFFPKYAKQKFSYITNHGNGLKNVIFLLDDFNSVEIEGNGAQFIFHGQVAPFQIVNCGKVTVSDISIDWDVPFLFQGEVLAVNKEEGWRDLKPFTKGYSWEVKNGRLEFPNIDGFSFSSLGSTLAFDPVKKRVSYGAWDLDSNPRWVEKRPGGVLRFHEPLKNYPPVGAILNSKGDKEQNRYAPAFQIVSSKNVHLEDVVVHHALGMGFLFERTDGIVISKCGVYVRQGSDRVVSTIADATHFANCKGDILIEDCRFEHMLDDGTNVHGTYVVVDKILDAHTVRVALKHFEQMGFQFAGVGDEVWFIHHPSPDRGPVDQVAAVKTINDTYTDLTFKSELPENITVGDILENKTWNPTFTMRGCTIKDHRARNVIIKTPKKIVIENNNFSSMMSSILLRGETFFWFESGAVEDVLIRHNNFEYVAYSGAEHAVLMITPRLGKQFDQNAFYDRNIRFEDNTIKTFDNRIVWADRVDGLLIKGNKIEQTHDAKPLHPDGYMIDLKNCRDVTIEGNVYTGTNTKFVKADAVSRKTLKFKKNNGIRDSDK